MRPDEFVERALLQHGLGSREKDDATGQYPRDLVRCSRPDASIAAVSSDLSPAEIVKLFGSAISWHIKKAAPVLRFSIVGVASKNTDHALYGLHSLLPLAHVVVQLEMNFTPFEQSRTVSDLADPEWVKAFGSPRELPRLGAALAERAAAAGITTFRWYRSVTGPWSGRLSGLQVCELRDAGTRLRFDVGRPGEDGAESEARQRFLAIIRSASPPGMSGAQIERAEFTEGQIEAAVELLKLLAAGMGGGSEEHRLESQILTGAIALEVDGQPLVPIIREFPFQFPTRWWPEGRPRYVDVMMRTGSKPWVVELKVDRGQGQYYRDGLVQVALYRNYVKSSGSLNAWFKEYDLAREDCAALLVVPTIRGDAIRKDHRAVATELSVRLLELSF
jgi:hypothetical protein